MYIHTKYGERNHFDTFYEPQVTVLRMWTGMDEIRNDKRNYDSGMHILLDFHVTSTCINIRMYVHAKIFVPSDVTWLQNSRHSPVPILSKQDN